MIRNILQRITKNRKGFTLVELMVTMVLIGLLIGASATGIFYYQKWSVWQRQEHYARTLFLAAQSGMTQYSADKRLEEFQKKARESAQAIVRESELLIPVTDEDGNPVSVSEIWKNTSGQVSSDLYYVTGTPADYQAYQNGNADAAHELLYDIFDAYLYDKTLLSQGCISVEFDARSGLVYSVLYSDRAKALAYGSCSDTTANIINRSKADRKGDGSENSTGLCFGYYGADTLSASPDASASKVSISEVKLNNEETLNLTWTLSSKSDAVSQLNYQVVICDSKTGKELLEISLNNAALSGQKSEEGYYYSIPAESAEDALKLVAAEVTSFVNGREEKLGTYPFLAYIDEDLTVTLVLDAVDLDATQALYETFRRTGEPGALADTLSLHRFGLEKYKTEEIYCIVQGGGSGYRLSARRQSNSQSMYFARIRDDQIQADSNEQSLSENDSPNEDTKQYGIENARHLYNIRFAEMVTDAVVYDADSSEKTGNDYIVTQDFAWGYDEKSEEQAENSILAKGLVYRSGIPVQSGSEEAFVMITQLREGSSLGCAEDDVHTIDYLVLSYDANEGTQSTNRWYPQGDGTALILENLGTIHDLILDHVTVWGGDYTAAFCAYNAGELKNLEIVEGSISGENYVGGIFAVSLPMWEESDEYELTALINRADITAGDYAGGIAAKNSSILVSCVNEGCVSGESNIGAITGENEGIIKDPVLIETIVTANSGYAGGVAAVCSKDGEIVFEPSSSGLDVSVEGTADTAGTIAGYFAGTLTASQSEDESEDESEEEIRLITDPTNHITSSGAAGGFFGEFVWNGQTLPVLENHAAVTADCAAGIAAVILAVQEEDAFGSADEADNEADNEAANDPEDFENFDNVLVLGGFENHGTIKGISTAAGIAAQSELAVKLEDCVNTGLIFADTAAGITTVQSGELVLLRCQNYAPVTSQEGASFGITDSDHAVITDCVGVSDNTYPIAKEAQESQNCWYFEDGGKELEQQLECGIRSIALTAGEMDRNGIYKEAEFTDAEALLCPIYTVRLNGVIDLSAVKLAWLGEAQCQFDIFYADAQDGQWKTLVSGAESSENGDGAEADEIAVSKPVQASALRIIITGVSEGSDAGLSKLELEGSWQSTPSRFKDQDNDSGEEQNQAKKKGIGTALYVMQSGDLEEDEKTQLYNGWGVLVSELSASPLLLNTEEAKKSEDDGNIRIQVWEKIREELKDLSAFACEEQMPGQPGGITFTDQSDTVAINWQPGSFAQSYEYQVDYYDYERDDDKNPVQEADGSFRMRFLGSESGKTDKTDIVVSDQFDGVSAARISFEVRAVNEKGVSDWVFAQSADEPVMLPKLQYHLKLIGSDENGQVWYEIVIENKEAYRTLTADRADLLTVSVSGTCQTQFALEESGRIAVSDEDTIFLSCYVLCPGYRTSKSSEKTFHVLAAGIVSGSQAAFNAVMKPDQSQAGFLGAQAQRYRILTGCASAAGMEIRTAFEAEDEALGIAVQRSVQTVICSTDAMEPTVLDVFSSDLYEDDRYAKTALVAYPLSLDNGQVELGHIILAPDGSQNWSAEQLLSAYINENGDIVSAQSTAAKRLIENGLLSDGFAVIRQEDAGYQLYYSPLLKNSTLSQYSSDTQSMYGIWRYQLTDEERRIKQPVSLSANGQSVSESTIDGADGVLILWDGADGKPAYEGAQYFVTVTAVMQDGQENVLVQTDKTASSSDETTYLCRFEPLTDCAKIIVQAKRTGFANAAGFTVSRASDAALTVIVKEPEKVSVQLTTPELDFSDEQEFFYPVFEKDENGDWKSADRKASACQSAVYFDANVQQEGCAGYEVSMLSLIKTQTIAKEELSYRDALNFNIVKDDSESGFHIAYAVSTKSLGYTMYPDDSEGGCIDPYEEYTDRENGIYYYCLPYYAECESEQEKVLVYAWLRQTNEKDENGILISSRFELFMPDGAAPIADSEKAAPDMAVFSVRALAEEDQTQIYGWERYLDSDVGRISRADKEDGFTKSQSPKEELSDLFSDSTVEESENTGFAYCWAQGAGEHEYLMETRQIRMTADGRQTSTYRILPVYWKYDEQGIQKEYFVYLPEDGYAIPYFEQDGANEPYLLYDLSVRFCAVSEDGLSDWSEQSADDEDADPKTFVLKNHTQLGRLTAPWLIFYTEGAEREYPLLDENEQTSANIRTKTTKLCWSWNTDWDKAAGFEARLSFTDNEGQVNEIFFDWKYEDWIKDPEVWQKERGSALLERLVVYELKDEEASSEGESSEEETSMEAQNSTQEETSMEEQTSTQEETSMEAQNSAQEETSMEAQNSTQEETSMEAQNSAQEETSTEQEISSEPFSEEGTLPEASVARRTVILRAVSLEQESKRISYVFEIKAVLTVERKVSEDGTEEYLFTLEIPTELISGDYTDELGEELTLMQLTDTKLIMKLKDDDSPYYGQLELKQQ